MPNEANFLTSPEAGLILGKSARTVQRMVDAGTLVAAQKLPGPNGAYLFRRSDIDAFLDAEAARVAGFPADLPSALPSERENNAGVAS